MEVGRVLEGDFVEGDVGGLGDLQAAGVLLAGSEAVGVGGQVPPGLAGGRAFKACGGEAVEDDVSATAVEFAIPMMPELLALMMVMRFWQLAVLLLLLTVPQVWVPGLVS